MNNTHTRTLFALLAFFMLFFTRIEESRAQACIPPAKQVVLIDQVGNYYVFWKPATPPSVINFSVKIHCTNLPPCSFTVAVTQANVIKMNGGWLGVKIPALPSTNSMVELSILPPNCPPQYVTAFSFALDLVTDNLDVSTADCDGDTCKIFIKKWTTLKGLTNYAKDVCGGAGAAVAASTVTAVSAPVGISLRKNANGKWQLKTQDSVYCDSCYAFIFQITCPDGSIYFVEDSICFNYTGPPIGCKETNGMLFEQNMTIYPNPANDKSVLQLHLQSGAKVFVTIYSSLGDKVGTVYSGNLPEEDTYEIDLPVATLTQGLYIVEVRINDDVKRMKLMKF